MIRSGLTQSTLKAAVLRMNVRVFFAAILGDILYFAVFIFWREPSIDPQIFYIGWAILGEVTIVSALLLKYGRHILDSKRGIFRFRMIFGNHAVLYATVWGLSCSQVIERIGMVPHSISVTSTVLAASCVAVAAFAFDLFVCLSFLAALLLPLLYVSLFTVEHGIGLAGACTLSILFFAQLAYVLSRSEVQLLQNEEMLTAQSSQLKEANHRLAQSNERIRSTIASVEEIFLLFDLQGLCTETPSTQSESAFGPNIIGQPMAEILRIPESERESFQSWFKLLSADRHNFDSLAAIFDDPFHSPLNGNTYRVRFFALRDNGGLKAIVATFLDITTEIRATLATEKANDQSNFILSATANRDSCREFIEGFESKMLALAASTESDFDRTKVTLHNLKGLAGVFQLQWLVRAVSDLENELRASVDASSSLQALKQSAPRLAQEFRKWRDDERLLLERLGVMGRPVITIDRRAIDLVRAKFNQDLSEKIIGHLEATNVGETIDKMEPRLQTLATKLNKKVRLEVSPNLGTIAFIAPKYKVALGLLIHIFNNSIDHGIEDEETRFRSGKNTVATLRVSSKIDARDFHLFVEDDGRGLDLERIRASLSKRGLAVPSSETDLMQSIFALGLSTKDRTTDLSGQGVGLHSLQSALTEIGGSISVTSVPGKQICFHLKFPLSADAIWVLEHTAVAANQ